MKEIQLTQGKVARVSDHRFEELNQYKWYADYRTSGGGWQARSGDWCMHQMVMRDVPKPDDKNEYEIDHVDRDSLNNEDENLRWATRSQNQANRPLSKSNTSGFKGVSFNRTLEKWVAYIRVNGELKHLGCFFSAANAARAYNKAALRYFGPFAHQNPV